MSSNPHWDANSFSPASETESAYGSTEYPSEYPHHDVGELSQRPLSILMNSQKEMLELFNKLYSQISNIEKTMMSSSNSSSVNEEKCRIPPQLSVSVYFPPFALVI